MPSNHLTICRPILLLPSIFPSIRVFSNESAVHISWQKYWSFSFSINPSNEYSGLIPLGLTGLISWQSEGLSKVFPNTTVGKHQFFGALLSLWYNSWQPYMTTGKTITLTRQTFVGKVMSLLFNTLSRFVTAFLPRSNCLLISWLQSPSSVISYQKRPIHLTFQLYKIFYFISGILGSILKRNKWNERNTVSIYFWHRSQKRFSSEVSDFRQNSNHT